MLFSATMPGAVVALARRYMNQPTHIRAMANDDGQDSHTVQAVEQFVYRAHAMDKVEMLARMLQANGRGLTIVFSRTKRTAAKVADDLTERGFAAAAIHGDLGQGAREQALRAFRNGKVDILVATDIRGPRHRRRERHARHQLPVSRGREDLRPPHRPHRPRGQHRHRRHLRRLGRHPALGPDQQGPRPRHPRARRRRTPPRRTSSATSTSRRGTKGRLPHAKQKAWAWAPRCSRTSARPASPPGAVAGLDPVKTAAATAAVVEATVAVTVTGEVGAAAASVAVVPASAPE